ncbi:hypothetical protein BC830DRAFT_1133338 [Chytriomyces sp. MP71]|nr:hypothetical protein BC830DRAFT_1133338 [Chytriomyces sp. MP71]
MPASDTDTAAVASYAQAIDKCRIHSQVVGFSGALLGYVVTLSLSSAASSAVPTLISHRVRHLIQFYSNQDSSLQSHACVNAGLISSKETRQSCLQSEVQCILSHLRLNCNSSLLNELGVSVIVGYALSKYSHGSCLDRYAAKFPQEAAEWKRHIKEEEEAKRKASQ